MGSSQELLNPGFDEPKQASCPEYDEAAGWERWGSWANRFANQPQEKARHGDGLIVYVHWRSDSPDAGWYQDVKNLTGGVFYQFSVWARWDANCNASNVELRIESTDKHIPYKIDRYTAHDIKDKWTYITVQARLPREVNEARIVIKCTHGYGGTVEPASGAIKFDDASLKPLRLYSSTRFSKHHR